MNICADDGFFFGIGAFETIAVEGGTPIFLEAHLKRLEHTATFLNLPFSETTIRKEIARCLSECNMNANRGVLKITLSPENLLVTTRENHYTEADYQRGFSTFLSPIRRNETSPLTAHKTLNYGDCILEKRRASTLGFDEPLFLNTKGQVAEGATTNIFLVQHGQIFTPPVSCGLLPGVMRDWVMRHYPVQEKILYADDIRMCEELFLTNSLLGVMPVSQFEDFRFPSQEMGRTLLEDYFRFCS